MKTCVIKINPKNPDKDLIKSAAKAIREGLLVAFPTETVYGIAVNALNKKAIENLYKIKGRSKNKPFTVHIANIKMIKFMGCAITKDAFCLINKFWPGPLTIVLKAGTNKTLGFRIPSNKIALELIRASGVPVLAPSANLSGNKAPISPGEVLKELDGKINILIDGGNTDIGVESTVVDLTVTPPKILRQGAIREEILRKALS